MDMVYKVNEFEFGRLRDIRSVLLLVEVKEDMSSL